MKIVVTYVIPEDAPEWFLRCVEDGDESGMIEYVEALPCYRSVEVIR